MNFLVLVRFLANGLSGTGESNVTREKSSDTFKILI